jgi:hypothetical protein
MKKGVLWLLICCIWFVACDSSTNPGVPVNFMEALLNGVHWGATATCSIAGHGALIRGTMVGHDTTESIAITLDSVVQGVTIRLGGDSANLFGNQATYKKGGESWRTTAARSTGSVTITALGNDRIRGTFAFILFKDGIVRADSVNVESGVFEATYDN